MLAANSAAQAVHRRERLRRIGFSVAASLAARSVSMVSTLITIPLALDYLGTERYAVWVTLSSITAILAFADLGIGNGLINTLSEANGREDQHAAKKAVSSAFFMLLALMLAFGVILALAYPLIDWSRVYNIITPLAQAEAGAASALFLTCFLLNMPLGLVQKIQLGYQEAYIDNLWFIGGKLFGLGAVYFAVQMDSGLIGMILALTGVPLLFVALNGLWLFGQRRPWLRPTLHDADPKIIRTLINLGWLFFVLQIAGTFAYNIDNLVIAQIISSEAVTLYSIPSQLFKLITVVVSLVSLPLWPAYGEAIARHDVTWVKTTFKRSLALNFAVSTIISMFLLIFGERIITLWVGQVLSVDPVLMIMLAIWTILFNVSSALAMLFNAATIIRFQVFWASLMAVVNLSFSILLTHYFGVIGVVLGSILSYILCIFPPYFLRIPRLYAGLDSQEKLADAHN